MAIAIGRAGQFWKGLIRSFFWWLISEQRHPRRRNPGLPPASFLTSVLLFAFVLRLASATGPLWLDEIWSLELAQKAGSTAGVFELREDNNHILNTIVLRAIGPGRPSILYRLPAVAFGAASVLLVAVIASRGGATLATLTSSLFASSYLLVHYSSEARGYAPVIFFAVVGCEALLRQLESPRWTWLTIFWTSSFFGLLSHPIFIHFLVAALCWSATNFVKSNAVQQSLAASLRNVTLVFGIPSVLTALLYLSIWRHFDLGGGPAYSFLKVIGLTGSLALGGPSSGFLCAAFAISLIALCSLACSHLKNDKRHLGLFLLLMLGTPIVMAIALQPPFLFPRYFLMSVVAVPFALAIVLERLFYFGTTGRWVASAAFLCIMSLNLLYSSNLINKGRGQYTEALHYMAIVEASTEFSVSSDHNFGVRKLIQFFSRSLEPCQVRYMDGDKWTSQGPDWLILNRMAESDDALPEESLLIDGHRFELSRMFDCSILSGWQWWCYRQIH